MRFDVSELKTFNECGRKWQLSSRNALHLTPHVTPTPLFFGTIFHKALHRMYVAGSFADIDKIVAAAKRECAGEVMLEQYIEAMLTGYYAEVFDQDIQEYLVLDIEHQFNIEIENQIFITGSIDMIALRLSDNTVWGFEHKSAQKFRPEIYRILDEQPKTYTIALQRWCKDRDMAFGGLYINEVKKLRKGFEYRRSPCIYTPEVINKHYKMLIQKGIQIQRAKETQDIPPNPGYMKCQMCDYATVCEYIENEKGGNTLLAPILLEFSEEFKVRERDHLDEKSDYEVY